MNTDAAYYRLAIRIFADFSGSIAVPAVFAALIGKWLDEKYGTEPKFLALFLLLALLSTAWIVVKKAKRYQKEYDALNKKASSGK
jgi:F0F1-type ATP synthase assembly protein I